MDVRLAFSSSSKCFRAVHALLPLVISLLMLSTTQSYQYDGDYYDGINASATNEDLKTQLQSLLSQNKTVLSYDDIWNAFSEVDKYLFGYPCNMFDSTFIPDIYSMNCWNPIKGLPSGGECGSSSPTHEGQCFNREHAWPNSWFGGQSSDAYTDLFLLFPSDGYVNNKRGNIPLGDVDISSPISYLSSNGAMIGQCLANTTADYTGPCFELPLYLKGDIARAYFYVSVAYYKVFTCCEEPAVSLWDIHTWEENILRKWHFLDPVDDTERSRNDIIFSKFQHNRNPFIDHPEWVDQIQDF